MTSFHHTGRFVMTQPAATTAVRCGSRPSGTHDDAIDRILSTMRRASKMVAEELTFNPWDSSEDDEACDEEDRTTGGSSVSSAASSGSRSTRLDPRHQSAVAAALQRPFRDERHASGVNSEMAATATDSVENSVLRGHSIAATAGDSMPNSAVHPDAATMSMVNSFFAFAFAAFTLGVLACLGVVVPLSNTCPAAPCYSKCAMLQDLRLLMSFFLGATLCWSFSKGKERAALYALDGSEKTQLYAYML